MPVLNQPSQSTFRLADRMAVARRGRFVGREAELELFRSALLADEPPFAVLHLYGPGGIGKTTLLREYVRMAQEWGIPAVLLDGRNLDPSPPGFWLALRQALGLEEAMSPLEALARAPRSIVLIDTFETLAPLDAWLRETFLPQLPGQSLVVMAGRNSPASAWRIDLDWADLTRIVSLRNLRPEESQTYLAIRGIPEDLHLAVLAFTHGHPLALSLVTDVLSQSKQAVAFSPQNEPDVVRMLLERFVQHVPSPTHRQALEICAHARVTTETLLADALGARAAHNVFEWLRGLSFIEQGSQGLFPHDLAREVLDVDLRWRNPDGYRQLHRQVRHYIVRKLQETSGVMQQQACFDFIYLQRNNPIAKSYLEVKSFGSVYAARARLQDHPDILAMVRRHEGEVSTQIVQYWLQRQPQAFTIFCTADQQPIGFIATLTITTATLDDLEADPAIKAAWTFAQHYRPVRPGEEISYKRFWMGRDTYQVPSAVFNMVAMTSLIQWLTRPKLAWSFAAYADPDYWYSMYTYINFQRSPEADFEIGGQRFGVFTHDWRIKPMLAWLDVMAERELATDLEPDLMEAKPVVPLVVLSEPEFADAVRQAMRDYTRPNLLADNPLMRSRLVVEAAEQPISSATLQALLREAAEILTGNPKDEKLYRAIHYTYLEPAPTQEQAAERLDLPFNTYRYHLDNGLKRITAWLWQRELHDFKT